MVDFAKFRTKPTYMSKMLDIMTLQDLKTKVTSLQLAQLNKLANEPSVYYNIEEKKFIDAMYNKLFNKEIK